MIFLKQHKKYITSTAYKCDKPQELDFVRTKSILTEICISHFIITISVDIEKYKSSITMRISIIFQNSSYLREYYGVCFKFKGDNVNSTYNLAKRKFNKKTPRIFKYTDEIETMDDYIENISIKNANESMILEMEEDINITPHIKWKKVNDNQIFDGKRLTNKFASIYNIQIINDIDIKKRVSMILDNVYLRRLYRMYLIMQF